MESTAETFLQNFRAILSHSKKEGPHTNILQFQQEASERLEELRREILSHQSSCLPISSSLSTPTSSSINLCNEFDSLISPLNGINILLRLVAIDASLGALLVSVEEEERGLPFLLHGYTVLQYLSQQKLKDNFHEKFHSLAIPPSTSAHFAAAIIEKDAVKSIVTLTEIISQVSYCSDASSKLEYHRDPTSDGVVQEYNPLPFVSFPYWGSSLLMLILNGLALYATKTLLPLSDDGKDPLNTAVMLLEFSESVYYEWERQHTLLHGSFETCSSPDSVFWLAQMKDIIREETGELELDAIPSDKRPIYWERYLTEEARLHTFFFLAQGLTHQDRIIEAFRLCRITLYLQFVLHNKEISPQEWAKNMLQLSSHYCSSGAYGKALHCLQAADAVLSSRKAIQQEKMDETLGHLFWSYGKYYKSRLEFYGDKKRRGETNAEDSSSLLEKLDFSKGWMDFPVEGVPPSSSISPITDYDEARSEFIQGLKRFHTALEYFPFEKLCTSHIAIQQDICRLYEHLCAFETDPLRIIACVQREVRILEPFASKLNFNAHPTLQRQLLFDTSCLRERLVELCIEQRKCWPSEEERKKVAILTDALFNKLIDKTINGFTAFCSTWITEREMGEQKENNLPAVTIESIAIEEENREPFFRALARIGSLLTLKAYNSPKDEYDGIKLACEAYEKALAFEKRHPMLKCSSVTEEELNYTKEILHLLQRQREDLYAAYSSKKF